MSSLTDYSNVGVELGAHTNSIDADIDYCCPNAKPPIVFHTPQHSETQVNSIENYIVSKCF